MNFQKVLIVGGGLAGISIAERLEEREIEFQLIDSKPQPSSTSVATGIINPIAFRRINLSWMIDELLPVLLNFYTSIEKKMGKEYLSSIRFAKHIPSDDYSNLWNSRAKSDEYQDYIKEIQKGRGDVLQAGILDCSNLIEDYLNYLENHQRIQYTEFSFEELAISDDGVNWNDEHYDHVIFCEGPYAEHNDLWKWLPFNTCKGEWIVIQTEKEVCSMVVNNVVNIIPLGNCQYKLSSTFRWEDWSWENTQSSETELIEAFRQLFDVPYKIIEQRAGLRPTVADRRPYLGRHPKHSSISIFNGLGTKGVMLAPYFSDHLITHLADDAPLLAEVDIQRHIKRYANSLLVTD